jgi:hypothetical protein
MSRQPRSKRVSIAAGIVTVALTAGPALISQPAFAATSANLLKNPGAERGTGSNDGSVVPVSGWVETNGASFTEVQYGATGGFPTPASPGPANRGHTFFAGGPDDPNNSIVATQIVKLKPYLTAIKSGGVRFSAQAYLGGMGSDDDQALVEIDFLDAHGFLVGSSTTLPAGTAADRGNVTGLLERSAGGRVPKGARAVSVQLIFDRVDGTYNYGFADNLSFTLKNI